MFCVPPIISGTGKATNFKFCTHILSIDLNKSPLKISGQIAGCVVRTLKTFQGTHILRASRGLLCDSSAVLFTMSSYSSCTSSSCKVLIVYSIPDDSWMSVYKFTVYGNEIMKRVFFLLDHGELNIRLTDWPLTEAEISCNTQSIILTHWNTYHITK